MRMHACGDVNMNEQGWEGTILHSQAIFFNFAHFLFLNI